MKTKKRSLTVFLKRVMKLISFLLFRLRMLWLGIPIKRHYKVISLGLGQQSTTLYLMSSTGQIERADVAIFSDPGAEGKATYKHLRWLKKWARKFKGIPILCVGKKSIYRDVIHCLGKHGRRFASIPAFTKNEAGKTGMLRRQCTQEYKTNEIKRTIRRLYGIRGNQRTPRTEIWLAITQEEMERMKYPEHSWMIFVYPFLNTVSLKSGHHRKYYTKVMRRSDCIQWLREKGFPLPPKSACTFCPYQGDRRWLELKREDPKEWRRVVRLDALIRNSTAKGVQQPIYLHRSCKPLAEAELNESQLELFTAECYGQCGT